MPREKTNGREIRFDSTNEIDFFLAVKMKTTGRTRQQIAREALNELALAFIREHRAARSIRESFEDAPELAGLYRKLPDRSGR